MLLFSVLFALLSRADALPFLGVGAHLAGDEYPKLGDACAWMQMGGVRSVRCDAPWRLMQPKPDAPIDFARFDEVLAECQRRSLVVLPILGSPPAWAEPLQDHLGELAAFAEAFVRRYGTKCPTVEFLNETNLSRKYNGTNVTHYVAALRTVHDAVKSADTSVRVAMAGTAGIGVEYLRSVYEAGGKDCFDVMSTHPYSNPLEPETKLCNVQLSVNLEKLRALMTEWGDGNKPIIVTELGWSTQSDGIGAVETTLLETGLRLARPDQRRWRVAYIEPMPDGAPPPDDVPRAIQAFLPPGSSAIAVNAVRLGKLLAADALDCVIYPIRNETYVAEAHDAVVSFVKRGGVLVKMGGMPFYQPDDKSRDHEADCRTLRLGAYGPWDARKPPETLVSHPTEAAMAVGFKRDLSGYKASRYITGEGLMPGDEFIPLIVGTGPDGREHVSAAVIRYGSDFKGALVVSALITRHPAQQIGTVPEENQGLYVARGLAICAAEGVESTYVYEFRSPESDPYYSECHFGMVHDNFAPKPAFSAYRTFSVMRPEGSVNVKGTWHDEGRTVYFPRWRRPDGRKAGMFWTSGVAREARQTLNGRIRFYDVWGRLINLPSLGGGSYVIPLSGSPIYWMEME